MTLEDIEKLTEQNHLEINALNVNLAAAMKLITLSLAKHGMTQQEIINLAQQAFDESQNQFETQAQGDTEDT